MAPKVRCLFLNIVIAAAKEEKETIKKLFSGHIVIYFAQKSRNSVVDYL